MSGRRMLSVKVFPVKVVDDSVYLFLPPQDQLDALLATELHCVTACETSKPVDLAGVDAGDLTSLQPTLVAT